jgi:hypothetical protein
LDRDQIVEGSDGQVVGQDAEASGVGGVGDADFLAFRFYVSVAADLVAETVTEVAGGLSGESIAEAGLAELVLGMVLGGGDRRIAVSDGIGGGDGGSCVDSGRSSAKSGERIGTLSSFFRLNICSWCTNSSLYTFCTPFVYTVKEKTICTPPLQVCKLGFFEFFTLSAKGRDPKICFSLFVSSFLSHP